MSVAIKACDHNQLNMSKLNLERVRVLVEARQCCTVDACACAQTVSLTCYLQDGWHWNALQSPPALHFCFTPNHVARQTSSSPYCGTANK